MTAQLRPAPIGHSRQPGDAAWPSRVVVLNDVSVVRGGATAMALLSARKIAEKGIPVAYLDIPPGIPTASLLTRKIGVRGSVRYVESLGSRLITVRDLDPLDDLR